METGPRVSKHTYEKALPRLLLGEGGFQKKTSSSLSEDNLFFHLSLKMEKIPLKCNHCGNSWNTKSKKPSVTCSNCLYKVNVSKYKITKMTIPSFSEIGLPLLKFAKNGFYHKVLDLEEHLVAKFGLTDEEAKKEKKSGGERLFLHKIRWVRTHLKYAGLIEDPRKGDYKITQRGLKVLRQNPPSITEKYLQQFPEYSKWRKRGKKQKKPKLKKYFTTPYRPKSKSNEEFEKEYSRIENEASKQTIKLSKKEIDINLEEYRKKKTPIKTKTRKSKVHYRDPKLAALMKAKSNYKCQTCEKPTFKDKKNGKNYTEAHHIEDVAKGGPDIPENILIVCPICHKIFDKGDEKSQIRIYKIIKKKKLFSDFKKLLSKRIISENVYNKII